MVFLICLGIAVTPCFFKDAWAGDNKVASRSWVILTGMVLEAWLEAQAEREQT